MDDDKDNYTLSKLENSDKKNSEQRWCRKGSDPSSYMR